MIESTMKQEGEKRKKGEKLNEKDKDGERDMNKQRDRQLDAAACLMVTETDERLYTTIMV